MRATISAYHVEKGIGKGMCWFAALQNAGALDTIQMVAVGCAGPGDAGSITSVQAPMPLVLYVVHSSRQNSCRPSQFPHPAQPLCPGRLRLSIPALFPPTSLQTATAPGLPPRLLTGTRFVVPREQRVQISRALCREEQSLIFHVMKVSLSVS